MAKKSTLGGRISQRRKELGFGQLHVAEQVGVSRSQVSLWENDRAVPGVANIKALARVLGVTQDWLWDGDPQQEATALGGVVLERGAGYEVVPVDEEVGLPLQDELEQLREWLPDDMTRRMSRKLTPRVWLGMLYAFGAEEGWGKDRLGRIHATMQRLDDEAERS